MEKGILFYDIEVFKYDSLVVFKHLDGSLCLASWNDDPGRPEAIAALLSDNVLCGYNNYHYDDRILTLMLDAEKTSEDIKKANDTLVSGYNDENNVYIADSRIDSIDCMQQIDVSLPSLKQIEGNLGISIQETEIPFDLDRPLTAEERASTEYYCGHDVDATIEVYKLRKKSYFDVKDSLIQMLPENLRSKAKRWNTTTIAANLLDTGAPVKWTGLKGLDRFWRKNEYIPEEVWAMWEGITTETVNEKGNFVSAEIFDCEVTFGIGGLHGAPSQPETFENGVIDADVSSMYPSIITLPEIRALGKATDTYDQMRTDRIACKKSDPTKAAALKLILNSVYGNFKNRYSSLNNPFASATVCIYGQIAAIGLCAKLHEAGYRITNINTDGVMFLPNPEATRDYNEICREWESEYGLGLETEHFDRMIQRDVNNYIAITNGEIKAKGGDVNKYAENHYFKNNDCRIVQIALVDYLAKGIRIEDTFAAHLDDPSLWQYVLKAGPTYRAVRDSNGNAMNKVNRVFATKPETPGATQLKKWKADGTSSKFADAPEVMYVWNDDISDLKDFLYIIDTEPYKALVEKKIEAWNTAKKKPKKLPETKETEKTEKTEKVKSVKIITAESDDPLESIARHFRGARKKSNTEWIAYCPIHEADGEHNPSLSICKNKKGNGYRCICNSRHCKESEILKTVRLTYEDLGRKTIEDLDTKRKEKIIRDLSDKWHKPVTIAAMYDYTEADGTYAWTKLRYYVKGDSEKKMDFIRKTKDEDLYYFTKGKLHPDPLLYNLPELIKAIDGGYPVYYVEGEKDVETLRNIKDGNTKWVATTAGSSKEWKDSMKSVFRGATVTIFADNDPSGKECAEKVRNSLKNVAFKTRIFVPSFQDKGDITDYLESEGDIEQIKARLAYKENEFQYAGWVNQKLDAKGNVTAIDISQGILQRTIERNEYYYMASKQNTAKQILYRYTGKFYEKAKDTLFATVQKYVPKEITGYSEGKLRSVANLLQGSSNKIIEFEELEKESQYIIVSNGVIDTKEVDENGIFKLEPHDPKHMITTCLRTMYDPEATCPVFMKYLDDLCSNEDGIVDKEKERSMAQYIGLTISNYRVMNTKHVLWLNSTQGNTGKSQLLKVINALVGPDKVCNIQIGEMNRGQNKFSMSAIVGKRVIEIPDASETYVEDSSIFKQLTGNDPLSIEAKGCDMFTYNFMGSMIICSNGYTHFKDDKGDHIGERLLIIPCEHHIEEKDRDPNLASKMIAELPGILNWALAGLADYLETGELFISESSKLAYQEYNNSSSSVARYLSEYYIITKDHRDRIKKSDFDDGYEEWYKSEYDNSDFIVKKNNIKNILAGRGIRCDKGKIGNFNGAFYSGLVKK